MQITSSVANVSITASVLQGAFILAWPSISSVGNYDEPMALPTQAHAYMPRLKSRFGRPTYDSDALYTLTADSFDEYDSISRGAPVREHTRTQEMSKTGLKTLVEPWQPEPLSQKYLTASTSMNFSTAKSSNYIRRWLRRMFEWITFFYPGSKDPILVSGFYS